MRSTGSSNYAGQQQYLLSSGAVASTGLVLASPRQTQPNRRQSRSSSPDSPATLSMAASSGAGRIHQQQQHITPVATTTTTLASNYPHPQPPMASNKLKPVQQAPQLAPVPTQVHYHNSAIGGFKAALRHPQKFIHNLYSGGTASKSASRQQVVDSKQALRHNAELTSVTQQHPQHQPLIQQQQLHQRPQVSRFPGEAPVGSPNDAHHLEPRQEQYASQLRSSPLVQRFQQHQSQQLFPASNQMQQKPVPGGGVPPAAIGGLLSGTSTSSSPQGPPKSPTRVERSQQVNFNRITEQPEEAGESRKKKYLTAKYGQQQMSLIKKRLKIEMWLYEQLQELAKSTKSEAELDEIEIDLDQLLDMDDDETRRRWLKKTLEPFEDLKPERIDKFINDVLDQSKLL